MTPELPTPRTSLEDMRGYDLTPQDGSPGDVMVFFETQHTLVILRGDIDIAVADDLEHAGRDAIDAEAEIVIDVRLVDMIDSVGISFLVRLAAAARDAGRAVVLLGPAPRVLEVLELVGADSLFRWRAEPLTAADAPA